MERMKKNEENPLENIDELKRKEIYNDFKNLKTSGKSSKNMGYLYEITMILRNSILNKSFKISNEYTEIFKFSKIGKKITDIFIEEKDIEIEKIKFIILNYMKYSFIFIDFDSFNEKKLTDIISQEILNKQRFYPDFINRAFLSDKISEQIEKYDNIIPFDETLDFIQSIPMGVFQYNKLVIGPLGVLKSEEDRYFYPELNVPGKICSDPSCRSVHDIMLEPNFLELKKECMLLESLLGIVNKITINQTRIKYEDHLDPFKIEYLIELLSNSFNEIEFKIIIEKVFKKYSKEIRNKLNIYKGIEKKFDCSPKEISKNLNKSECLQVLLLFSDKIIIGIVEELIHNEEIYIPLNEIRTNWKFKEKYFKNDYAISKMGIRRKNRTDQIAPILLRNLILHIYSENIEELFFKVRFQEGNTNYNKFDNYIYTTNPKILIKDLFTSLDNFKKVFSYLKNGYFWIPENNSEEEKLINKILWKLGFNIYDYSDLQLRFKNHIAGLLNKSKMLIIPNQENQEIIRKSGVNLWVLLEDILTRALSFSTWLLLMDHYRETNFKYNSIKAYKFMCGILSDNCDRQGNLLSYDKSGKNTLFPLVEGFYLLKQICHDIINESEKYKCEENDLPSFYNKTDIASCLFIHKKFLLDINKDEREAIFDLFDEIVWIFDNVPILKTRNGLDHNRSSEEFPSISEIEKVCKNLNVLLKKMEDIGILPLIYILKEFKTDNFLRKIIKLENYKGKTITNYFPSLFRYCKLPNLYSPLIIVPSIHLGASNENIRFILEEKSYYADFWSDYIF